jgi:hypothetical protein
MKLMENVKVAVLVVEDALCIVCNVSLVSVHGLLFFLQRYEELCKRKREKGKLKREKGKKVKN